ncbi:MAG TPA: hypothetical protein VIV60_06685 [Polyangiaceae bacterium]
MRPCLAAEREYARRAIVIVGVYVFDRSAAPSVVGTPNAALLVLPKTLPWQSKPYSASALAAVVLGARVAALPRADARLRAETT